MWSETDLAYFAGILDGEGCFCLHNPGTHRYSCQVHVGNTDLRMLSWIQAHFGGTVIEERRQNSRHKRIWRWISRADQMDAMLAAVMPFLICKRDQAELLQAYRQTLAHHGKANFRTPEHIKETRSAIHTSLSMLNRRGVA